MKTVEKRPLSTKQKVLAISLCILLLMGSVVGGVLAWLTSESDPIINTFSGSNLEISVDEEINPDGTTIFKAIPGNTDAKDPSITVFAGSEPCYLFVHPVKSSGFDNIVSYTYASGWTQHGSTGYYYYIVGDLQEGALPADETIYILQGSDENDSDGDPMTNGYIQYKTTATNDQLDFAEGDHSLLFKVVAVQQNNLTPAQAYSVVKDLI
ncbi:MAG: hypothetical protein IKT68_08540 [Clostridia bacterium]|nr:hypothetical protein [Clostridia bacterium]